MIRASDAELARHVAAGKHTAEGELCRRFSPRIRLYGLRHLRDEQAAADLVQDVLMTVLEALRGGRVRDLEEIGSFMLGTCRLTAMNQKRGGKRRAEMLETFADVLGGTVDPVAVAGADLDKLRGCVERLSERDRTVVMLTFYAEEPAEDIARALETTAGNVRVLRHRAMSRLQACVENGLEVGG